MPRPRLALAAGAAAVALLLAGCTSSGKAIPAPVPSGAPTGSSSSGVAPSSTAGQRDNPALDVCDDTGLLPCADQVARLSLPLAGTQVALTYASNRAAGRIVDRAPSADPVGLAGWTLSVLDTFDPSSRTVVTGAGSKRTVTGLSVGADTAVAAPDGLSVDEFDSSGREVARLDGITGSVRLTFTWGPHGLTSVSDPSGVALTVQRAADGTPVAITATGGATTRIGTVAGALAAVGYPDGSRAKVGQDQHGLVTALATAAGVFSAFRYDVDGLLVYRSGADQGAGTSYSRTADGSSHTVTTTLPGGGTIADEVSSGTGTTTFTHTDAGKVTTTVTASGMQRQISQQAAGSSDATHAVITLAPDPRWGTDAPIPTEVSAGPATVQAASLVGTPTNGDRLQPVAVRRTVSVNGRTWTLGYDPTSRTTTRTDPSGVKTVTTTDQAGRVTSSTTGAGLRISYTYTAAGRLATVTIGSGPDARTWTYAYGPSWISITDPAGGVQRRDLSPTGQLVQVTGPGSSGFAVTRDSGGRVTGFAAAGAAGWAITRDAAGRVAAVNAPAAADVPGTPQFTGYDYDAAGRLTKQFTADSTVTVTRDDSGRPTVLDAGAGPVSAAYDSSGRLITLTGRDATVTQTWNQGSMTGEKVVAGGLSSQISRTLTAAGRTAQLAVAGGTPIDFGYDDSGRALSAGAMTVHRDPSTGQVTTQTLGTLTDTLTRNQFGELTDERVTGAGGSAVAEVQYSRDRLGRVTGTVTRWTGPAGPASAAATFTYDAAGRLAGETTDGVTRGYTYDAAGNLTSITVTGGPSAGRTALTYDRRNALTSAGPLRYAFDGAGRLVSTSGPAGTTSYAWDGLGRLLGVASSAGKVGYAVDGFGRRIARTSGGAVSDGLVYQDSLRPAARLKADGSVAQQYVYLGSSTTPSYLRAGSTDYLEIPDASGGPGLVLDSTSGAVADRVVRTGYGQVLSESSPDFQAVGFAGGIVDPATTLVHFGARDYDTATGRWTAPDPLSVGGGSANLYEYVGGDPVDRQDSTGQFCDYLGVGLNVNISAGGLGYTGAIGIGTAGTQLGAYATNGASAGAQSGVSVVINCADKTDQTSEPQLSDFGGGGNSVDIGVGPASAGWDVGYNPDGSISSTGSHLGVGPSVGVSASAGRTDFWCIFGCPPSSPGQDSGTPSDDELPNGNCDGADAGLCDPSPSDPNNGAPDDPNNPQNMCASAGSCNSPDPSDSDGNGGPGSPPSSGPRTTGDPHLRTADGTHYDLQAVGEFTWLRSDSGDLLVQVRQQPLPGSRTVSLNSAVAVSLGGDVVRVTLPPGAARTSVMAVSAAGATLPAVGTVTLAKGTTLTRADKAVLLSAPDGTRIWIRQNPYGLDVNATLPDARKNHVHGLTGPFTGGNPGEVQTASGTELTPQDLTDYDKRYRTFGDSWRISQADSLFTDTPGDATAFDDKTFPDRAAPAVSAGAAAAAKIICERLGLTGQALTDCELDVGLTGDAGFASSAATANAVVPGTPAASSVGTGTGPISGDITPGASVSGSLTSGTDRDYAFVVPAGAVAYFAAAPGCREAAAADQIRWEVLDSDGGPLTGSDQICDDIGRVQFAKAGTYRLRIRADGTASGPYTVRWLASRPDAVQQISPDQQVSGTIDKPGARDLWTASLPAGTVAYYAADPGCTDPASGSPPVRWGIYAADGTQLTGVSSICVDIGRVAFPAAGTYVVRVFSDDGGTGAYAFRWIAGRPDGAQTMVAGQPATGTIGKPGVLDRWSVTVPAGGVGYFAASAACTPPASGAKGSVRWELRDPDGSQLTGLSSVCDDIGRMRFDRAGTYQVEVQSSDGGTGSYAVTWLASRPDAIRPLTMGATVSGTVDLPGAQDLWTFTAPAHTTVRLAPAAGCTSTTQRYAIVQADGSSVSGTGSICSPLTATLDTAGAYAIRISDEGPATGTYSFVASTS